MSEIPTRDPKITPDQLQALMTKHHVDGELVKEVFQLVARTHTNAVSATDIALISALGTGADPILVAMGMSRPKENVE